MRQTAALRLMALVASSVLAACVGDGNTTPLPMTPPQVFLTISESVVIGPSVSGTTSVSGCATVSKLRLLAGDKSFVADVSYGGAATPWTLSSGALARLYAKGGIALPLTLQAEVTCADGRTNTSQPASVTYFPAGSTVTAQGGVPFLPDAFVAEGGFGGTPTTFLGCMVTSQGSSLVRVDTSGAVVRRQTQLPFQCTLQAQISDRSAATLTRWLFEPKVGAFAFNASLEITAVVTGELVRMGVATDGNAIFGQETEAARSILRVRPTGASPLVWQQPFVGTMNASPVVDLGSGAVFASSWKYNLGTGDADFVVFRLGYADGVVLNAVNNEVPVVFKQSHAPGVQPLPPETAFSASGSLLFLALQATDAAQQVTTSVLACSTSGALCQGSARRWTSPSFPGLLTTVVPFSNDAFVAVAGAGGVGFVSTSDGASVTPGGGLLRPTGSLVTQSLLAGSSTDFFILAAPAIAQGFPAEIIAIDTPRSGELWRLAVGAGTSPAAGMYVAVDESGQPWLRVGLNLVKPLTNGEYRSARGTP
ncbi:MAG: hypothetical protein JNG84_03085 [Archangium sp.]|nr:hypothetical protein [Archangium sp.]